jgi:uncharacterized membrane protein YhaH (DUF805 family)
MQESPDASLPSIPRSPVDWMFLPRLWFGLSEPVGRRAYTASGFGLMLFKYGVEAWVIWVFAGRVLSPLAFVNPVWTSREELLQSAPTWLPAAFFVWSLPFLWIAVSMSVRRMADAGRSPWLGMTVLIPVLNLVFMVLMCCEPASPGDGWNRERVVPSEQARAKGAALAVGVSLLVGGAMLWTSVYLLSTYGASLFLGTPLVMGATAAYLYNRPHPRSWPSSIGVGLAAVFFAGVALLLFALEGVICVGMALPLMLPVGIMGGALGKAIADATRRPSLELAAVVIVLPLLAGGESLVVRSTEFVVTSAVDIDAPPATVWHNVVEFPDLPAAREWYFRLGIACPQRARIVGQGVGATRYCEFTTGAFVEPITHWDAPRRLAFDVAKQPDPMFELSPYRDVHPPHLEHHLSSRRGEFLLIALPDGRTRLEGRTWYTFEMFPQGYWTLWSDALIHRIHVRVLEHIKDLSESSHDRQDPSAMRQKIHSAARTRD